MGKIVTAQNTCPFFVTKLFGFAFILSQAQRVFIRNIEDYLHRWKSNASHKPLIIRGDRQVGKTTLIRDFARSYAHAIVLNLEKAADRRYFENFEDVHTIVIQNISRKHLTDLMSCKYHCLLV